MRHLHSVLVSTLLVLNVIGLSGCGDTESTRDAASSSPDQSRVAPQCQSNSDCDDSAMVCKDGVCLFVGRTPDCTSDDDCDAESVCDSGECIPK